MKQPATKYPEVKVRFKTFAALDRIEKAARIAKRTRNEFVRIAAEEAAEKLVTASKNRPEQLIAEPDPLALNQ